MDQMRMVNQDGEYSYEWVVYGDQRGCVLFDRTYDYKGHAVRRAKKIISEGDHACVVKPKNGNFYRVMKGNSLSDWLLSVAKQGDEEE